MLGFPSLRLSYSIINLRHYMYIALIDNIPDHKSSVVFSIVLIANAINMFDLITWAKETLPRQTPISEEDAMFFCPFPL